MTRRFSSRPYPYLPVQIAFTASQKVIQVEALVDTGFDGDIVFAESYANELGEPDSLVRWRLADGSYAVAACYEATAVAAGMGAPFPVYVSVLGYESMVGRALTDRFRVTLDHGSRLQ